MTTEATVETPTTTLIPNALYRQYGIIMIAVDDGYFVRVGYPEDQKVPAHNITDLIARPGSDDWINHMVRIRGELARDTHNERAASEVKMKWFSDLGQALLEKAELHDWCEEYDTFAEVWDLPTRFSEYDVTITMRVSAKSSDDAMKFVRKEASISSYDDRVIDGPEYSADAAY